MRKLIGVIGAGVMGTGVAERFAMYGYKVIVIDISDEILEQSKYSIQRDLKIQKMLGNESLVIDAIMERITFSKNYELLRDASYVIENVNEVVETKKKVYTTLCMNTNKDCIYLVNTSCISITKIGSYTGHPEKVIGVHFMNPVPLQKFAEIIRGFHTTNLIIKKVEELLQSVEIQSTVINDSVGFVSNRMSHIFFNEAANLVLEGVATPGQIDRIFTEGFHHKMGPLHTIDLIGVDTVVDSLKVLYDSYQDSKYRCSPLLQKMVDAGMLGVKNGKGFFEY